MCIVCVCIRVCVYTYVFLRVMFVIITTIIYCVCKHTNSIVSAAMNKCVGELRQWRGKFGKGSCSINVLASEAASMLVIPK